jgi:hypothetical protein
MKLSELANLAAKNKKSLPILIGQIVESFENINIKFDNVEKVFKDILPKLSLVTSQKQDIDQLRDRIKLLEDEIKVLKTWNRSTKPRTPIQKSQEETLIME